MSDMIVKQSRFDKLSLSLYIYILLQALTFYDNKNLVIQNLNIRDAQQIHVSFEKCTNVEASGFKITSPEISPNTDGIHITETQNIRISSSIIGTGITFISLRITNIEI